MIGRAPRLVLGIALAGLLLSGVNALAVSGDVDPPAPDGARALNLVEAGDRLLLTWIEPVRDGVGNGTTDEARLVFATFDGEMWSEPQEIVRGSSLLVNRADVPELALAPDGTMHAHWLETLGENAHAYGVRSARSTDGGQTWEQLGWLHDDESAVEHGFVSHALGVDGSSAAFWLDGRTMPDNGDTQLRVATLETSGPPPSQVLDTRVCECCSTDATQTSDGPLIVYRDRSPDEIRDISVIRWTESGWSEPATVHEDGWRIEGCPVNGPSVSARGRRVAVAWYTAADPSPRVLLSLSNDAGRSFSPPITIDETRPRGQVDVAVTAEGAAVAWLRREGGTTEVVWRHVSVKEANRAADDAVGPIYRIGPSADARLSGYPKLGRLGDQILAVWGEATDRPRVRAVALGPE